MIFVMVKCGALFEVRTEFLHITKTSVVFEGVRKQLQQVTQWSADDFRVPATLPKPYMLALQMAAGSTVLM
jgi:hypothetical protein